MEKIKLLDMDNDILKIIGRYVKEDNLKRIEIFKFIDEEIKKIKMMQKKKKEDSIKIFY